MLDPSRFSLDAATVGFRKRMKQSVNWESFNTALQTQTESIKVRRELEETPVSEIHVMGGQLYGIGGNQKTNEAALQARQMNGYPLRSFLVTGGPLVLPTKRSEGVMAIPINRGLPQYTQYNGVVGNYASSFTEPLHAPMESGQMLLARAGIQAKSDSIVNPYKALQFQLNMHKSQEEITDLEERHQQLRAYNQEGVLKTAMDAQNSNLSKAQRTRIMQGAGAASRQAFISPDLLKQGKKGLKRSNPMRNAVEEILDPGVIFGTTPSRRSNGYTNLGSISASGFGLGRESDSDDDTDYTGELDITHPDSSLSRYLAEVSAAPALRRDEEEDVEALEALYPGLDRDDIELYYAGTGRNFHAARRNLDDLERELRQASIERKMLELQPNSKLSNMSSISGSGGILDEIDLEGFRSLDSHVTNQIAQQAFESTKANVSDHNGLINSNGNNLSTPSAGNLTERPSSIQISGTPVNIDMSSLQTVNLFSPN